MAQSTVNTPHIGVVIIHYASAQNVDECLASLSQSTIADQLYPIIVENQPKEPLPDVDAHFTHYTVLKTQDNLGFTGANNLGMEWALAHLKSDSLILLNDDTTVDPKAFETILHTLRSRDDIAAVVPKIYFSKQHEYHSGYEADERGRVIWYAGGIIDWKELTGFHRGVDEVDRGQLDVGAPTPFATGCCVALKTTALRKVGVFDDRFFLYFEDADLSLRLQKKHYQVWYEPAAIIWHKNAGSSSSGSDTHVYYQTRNRFLFGWKHAPLRTKLFLLKQLWQLSRSEQPTIKRAILDVIKNNYGRHDI